MKTLLPAVATIGALLVMPAAAHAQPRSSAKTHVRQIFVNVTDAQGLTVTGLSAEDFKVTEGGQARTVTHVGPANQPMRIALMIDTSQGTATALVHIRTAVAGFGDGLAPDDEVAVITTGRQVRVLLPPTTDRQKVKDLAAGLFNDGGGTRLMEGLLEIDERFFRKVENRWPVFVIFTSDGLEISSSGRENEFKKWALELGTRGISAHALVLKTAKGRDLPQASGIGEIVAENLTQNTGGEYDVMNTTNGLPDKMTALARELARDHRNVGGWYAIDIQTPATDMKSVDVTIARDDVKLQIADRHRGR